MVYIMPKITKKRIIKDFAEIRIQVPFDKKNMVRDIIENSLRRADVGFTLLDKAGQDNETVSLEEIFPDIHAGSAIRGLRYREGMTQAQLAGKIGVKPYYISEMEKGMHPIGKEMAKRLAEALRTDFSVFIN